MPRHRLQFRNGIAAIIGHGNPNEPFAYRVHIGDKFDPARSKGDFVGLTWKHAFDLDLNEGEKPSTLHVKVTDISRTNPPIKIVVNGEDVGTLNSDQTNFRFPVRRIDWRLATNIIQISSVVFDYAAFDDFTIEKLYLELR